MPNEDISLQEAMLVVIYKKLDAIEQKLKGNSRTGSFKYYHDELKKQAVDVIKNISQESSDN